MTARGVPADREGSILRALEGADRYLRPMDVGGFDGSHHSRTLARLCARGLVERQPRDTLPNFLRGYGKDSKRARSWLYKITAAGQARLHELRGTS